MGLAANLPDSGTDHIHLIVALRRDETVSIHVATIEQVGPRQQITLSKGVVDGGTHDTIRRGGRGGDHLRDQIRLIRITGLREVELIAHPMGVTFTAVAGLQVVGRRDPHRRRRLLIPRAPAERFESRDGTAVILLQPYLPECLQGGKVPEVWRCVGGLHPRQELIAVRADLPGERLALARVLR